MGGGQRRRRGEEVVEQVRAVGVGKRLRGRGVSSWRSEGEISAELGNYARKYWRTTVWVPCVRCLRG